MTLTGQVGSSAGSAARPDSRYPLQRNPAQQLSTQDDLDDTVSPAFLWFAFGAALLALLFACFFWLAANGFLD